MAIPTPSVAGDLPEGKHRGAEPPRMTVVPMKVRGVVTQPEDRHRPSSLSKPFLMEHDILKVTNIDNCPWEFCWDRRRYYVKPGESGFVPFPALVMKLGDPRSAEGVITRFNTEDGTRGIIPERHDSISTLFAHYGISNEDLSELVGFAPKVEVRTMDTDELVTFPSQDPHMMAWPVPNAPLPGRENSDTRRLLDNLQGENQAMRAEIEEMRSMIRDRLSGTPESAPAPVDDGEDLASALAGATVDQGPNAQFR